MSAEQYAATISRLDWLREWNEEQGINDEAERTICRRANATQVPYSFMTVDAIAELPVGELKSPDGALLFLWSTRRAFREGWSCRIARDWGFEPVGEIIWGLRNPGMGSRALANDHEPILVAKSGKWAQLAADESLGVYFWRQVYEYGPAGVPQKKHSAKPPGFLELVERIAQPPRLELFAREARLGWDTWGDEALNHVSLACATDERPQALVSQEKP